jgi:glyoxylase-like metal-dependent hydrolase (beta-lactamase superfamily II)
MEPIRIELPTGLGVGSVNAYLFEHPEAVLVDAGIKSDECWDALVDGLAWRGLAVRDLSRVVITHAHVDHYGLAGRIVAESDATVWISDLGAPWLLPAAEKWQARLDFYRDDFLLHLGLPQAAIDAALLNMRVLGSQADPVPAERLVTFRPDGVLQMGGAAWQVIHTPGHASMQTVFHQPERRQLLSADMLLAVTPTPVVEQPPPGESRRAPALPLFLRSLDAVGALDVEVVYPGHGRPFGNHRDVVARQRERIRQRRAECLACVRAGLATIPELLDAMYAHQPPGMRMAGLWMLVGYLDLLIDAEQITCEENSDGLWRYRPN